METLEILEQQKIDSFLVAAIRVACFNILLVIIIYVLSIRYDQSIYFNPIYTICVIVFILSFCYAFHLVNKAKKWALLKPNMILNRSLMITSDIMTTISLIGFITHFIAVPSMHNIEHNRERGKMVACQYYLRDISTALKMYCLNSNEHIPIFSSWEDQLYPDYIKDPYDFKCPSANGRSGYAFNSMLNHKLTRNIPESTVLVFDSYPGWNMSGGLELAQYRHLDKCNFLFVDGRVKALSKSEGDKLSFNVKK